MQSMRSPIRSPISSAMRSALDVASSDPYGRVFLADADTGLLLPGFTYTRSGPDLWCPQADGSLKSFAADVIPREWANGRWGFRFDPGWIQSLRDTNDFSSPNWNKTNVSPVDGDFITGPFGTPVQAYAGNEGSSLKRLRQNFTTSALGPWTMHWLIKPDTETSADFVLQDSTASNGARFTVNLLTGEITSGPTGPGTATVLGADVKVLPTGFVDVSLSVQFNTALTQLQAICTWALNGASPTTGKLYPACCNLTNTSYPVPLTVAEGAAGTVGNHSCSALLSALGITLGSEYTLFAKWRSAATDASFGTVLRLDNGTNTERAIIRRNRTSHYASAVIAAAGTAHYSPVTAAPAGQTNTQALRARLNDARGAINGELMAADDGVAPVPSVNRVTLGHGVSSTSEVFIGWVESAALIPSSALTDTDAELQAVTA